MGQADERGGAARVTVNPDGRSESPEGSWPGLSEKPGSSGLRRAKDARRWTGTLEGQCSAPGKSPVLLRFAASGTLGTLFLPQTFTLAFFFQAPAGLPPQRRF